MKQILETKTVRCLTVSQYLKLYPPRQTIELQPSSWHSKPAELKQGQPYALWLNKTNSLQKKIWRLAWLAMEQVEKYPRDSNRYWSQWHLDRGLSSCLWWWASEVKTSSFAPIAWHPDHIDKGLTELVKSLRSLQSCPAAVKLKAEKLYLSAQAEVWQRHWQKYYKPHGHA